ncbi:MAG TPA: NUDIX hydrolase [Thermoanaerobaculia bacterium]|nr:NUDIX hydrolase [Thermoanaerobaculia bacterium]
MTDAREIYRGRLISLRVADISLPNGVTATFDIVSHPGASAVVAVDKDDNVVLVRVFRPAVGDFLYELPAGKVDGDDPIDAARRELREETGADARNLVLLTRILTAPGYSTEVVNIYFARDLVFGAPKTDDDEVLSVVRIAFREALAMVWRGEIKDSKTIVGLLLASQHVRSDA